MDITRRTPRTKVATSKRVTYALAGAGIALMALPLVTAMLPGEAGAARLPQKALQQAQPTTTSIGTVSVVPTDATVPRSTLTITTISGGTLLVFNPSQTQQVYTVGTGICAAEVVVSGAAGGNIQATVGGRGASIKGQFSVTAGEKYNVNVGAYRGGGAGGLADLSGGGASSIVRQSTSALVVEAGGGGGDSVGILTETNHALDTIPGATSQPNGTIPPIIQVNVVPGKGADAPAITAVTPVTATVKVPVGDVSATSTSLVNKSASAVANGAASDSGDAILSQDLGSSTTVQIAKVHVDMYAGGAGGGAGGVANKGGADADAGSAGTIVYPNPSSTTTIFSAPYVVGAAVGGSGGISTIGNGFLQTGSGANDQKDGKITIREIGCTEGGSTLPPLGGGRGASGPLLPAALALIGAGAGMLVVRRRGTRVKAA